MKSNITLAGTWCLSSDSSRNISCDIAIPGDIHSALLLANEIPDPYISKNESQVQWVAQTPWQIKRSFFISESELNQAALELWLESLDTIATVSINQQVIYQASNQFQRHIINIKPAVTLGENEIEILFHPVADIAAERAENLPFPVPWAVGNNQIPHMNTVRKAQCHAGWDWGICLLVAGLYEKPLIKPIDNISLRYVENTQVFTEDSCQLSIDVEYFAYHEGMHTFTLQLGEQLVEKTVTVSDGLHTLNFEMSIAAPKRWWPAGYGEQPLYDLTVAVDNQIIQQQIGLRELELVTEPDEVGASMLFRVNGRDIVCKGANWIPADAMPSRATSEKIDQLLGDAVAANMNMIRVWGGGIYESDTFYQLCDQKGLLVWQDLMFACAQYPSTPEFIADVEDELTHQLKRLQHHSCVALWCGDNEVIGSIGWYPESRENRQKYTVNYDRLNRALDQSVEKLDPSRRFWPSSPCNGELDFGDAWHDDNKGDMHFWDVWHSGKSFSAYREVNPRFCSEFGYQSFPSLSTVKTYAEESDWNITSPVMEWHQRNNGGNSKIVEMFTRLFRFPQGFENFLYLSQVQQALAIKTASEYWRSTKPICMGILYWQLNDVWPVASWSSIEYSGQWKQLHYHAKRFFAPNLVTFVPKDERLNVMLVSDLDSDTKFTGELVKYNFGGDAVETIALDVVSPKDQSVVIHSLTNEEDNQHFWHVKLVQTDNNQVVIENDYINVPWKACELQPAHVKWQVNEVDNGVAIVLSVDTPAFFVQLSSTLQGKFSDNSLTLLPNQPKEVFFQPEQTLSKADIVASLSCTHLRNTY
ncbi:glycoside hydrolase family 2 protein [Motilimonas cestriensis]|uniref:beta-mannosidase n=1 Tax=Motilimonas cestriensis TaxID=2742685 RepID=A0ABS8WFQ3_9GAMM|nr:glycoside hydrolase family 2 protein [Motilimonas cestriensis]MCE2596486.1 glycoside hydrolase family 2 protein [Motilimonas cestriensis]